MHAHDFKKIHVKKNCKKVATFLEVLMLYSKKKTYLRLGIFYSMRLIVREVITKQQTIVTRRSYKGKKQYGKSVTSKRRTC
jgi:hypothetical protein